jgi:hypothetical protein
LIISIRAYYTRKSFAVLCSFLSAAFTGLAVVGYFEPRNAFMFMLVCSFLALLFFFHAIFGFVNLVTAAQARAIDYVYLGIAAIGVFVLAFNYEGRRQDFEYTEKLELLSNELASAKFETMKVMVEVDTLACGRDREKPLPTHCDLAQMTDDRALDRETMEDKTKITVGEFLARLPTAPPAGQEEALARLNKYIFLVKTARTRTMAAAEALDAHTHKVWPRNHDIREESHGLFTWPFILAFAFALRLTRTTIEVFDWTIKPSPSK